MSEPKSGNGEKQGWLARRNALSRRVCITRESETDHWISGRVDGYTFHAKVYDVGSDYGIDQGRISKLEVKHKGEQVMYYDRGWVEIPKTTKDYQALREIVKSFPEEGQKAKADLSAKSRWGFRMGRGGF
jgi:hypothetical protein